MTSPHGHLRILDVFTDHMHELMLALKRSDTTSSSRPSSPSPARNMRSRMTSAMRRASTGLAFSTKMPTLSRSSSKNSLKVDPAQAPTTSDMHAAPSPVVETAEESPTLAQQLGPSPLQNSTAPAEPAPVTVSPPTPEQEPVSLPAEPIAPTEPVASVAPAAPAEPITVAIPEPAAVAAPPEESREEQLTRSPEQLAAAELSHPTPISVPEPQPFGFSDPVIPPTQGPAVVESPVIAPKDEITTEPLAEPTPAAPLPPPAEPAGPPVTEDRRPDYFSFSDPAVPTVASINAEEPRAAVLEAPATPARKTIPVEEPAHYQDASHVHFPTDDSTFAWSDEPALGHKRSRSSLSDPANHTLETSQQSSAKVSTKASKSSLASSYGNPLPPGDQRRGRSSSVRFIDPAEDPFADPPEVQKKGLSPIESVNMPEPVVEPVPERSEQRVQDSPTPISFPLPPMQDVIGAQSSRQSASAYSLGERDGASLADSTHHDVE
ncbi:hypothetical protein GY45DRAFT_849206 [Cubamyces sp. BRFM 1775]|nr:hypothetical protein GY45DRAFT_849206 [Cubamyces sp. BRFM 1775]